MTAKLADHLHQGLLARGYVVEAEVNSPESFGSWYRDYRRSDRQVRLIWDGRDGWFILQGDEQWRDLAIKRPNELTHQIEEFLAHAD